MLLQYEAFVLTLFPGQIAHHTPAGGGDACLLPACTAPLPGPQKFVCHPNTHIPPSNNLQEEGLQAIADLENSFKEFDRVLETGDKQAVPIRQQDALGYVGQIEEAMVKEFPYQVPSEYDYLPQLKVSVICWPLLIRAPSRWPCTYCSPCSEKGT